MSNHCHIPETNIIVHSTVIRKYILKNTSINSKTHFLLKLGVESGIGIHILSINLTLTLFLAKFVS